MISGASEPSGSFDNAAMCTTASNPTNCPTVTSRKSTASVGAYGNLAAAEFAGPPTFREVTVSLTACDFRPNDPTGAAGPLGRAAGTSATLPFVIGTTQPNIPHLVPGQTYYFNVRNYIPGTGLSCTAAQGRCDALVNIGLPR